MQTHAATPTLAGDYNEALNGMPGSQVHAGGGGAGGAGRMASAQHGMELRGVMVHWSRVVFEGLDGAGWIPS